jgi:periplasmic divalent cation tolerance protein
MIFFFWKDCFHSLLFNNNIYSLVSIVEKLAEILITKQLAACVNVLAPCTSMYQWQGKLEKASELPMMIKTTRSLYKTLERTILKHHPYELPEIICVTIADGLPAYLAWISEIDQKN